MMTFTDSDAAELFRSDPHAHIDVGGAEVAYRRIGTGPDVLFVHGFPVSSATFRTLLPFLVDHVTCHLIDLPGAGSSRFSAASPISVEHHVDAVRRVVEALDLRRFAVVGHDSGGMIARHALACDDRVVGMGLVDTEQPQGISLRFRMFVVGRYVPGFGSALGWVAGRPRLRRNGFLLGDAFVDRSLLDGEFDEFFLQPLAADPLRQAAATKMLRSYRHSQVHALAGLHRRVDVPVQLVWGEQDKFFPVARAREMVGDFRNARLAVVPDAGLFSHEERPAEVAAALLPVLVGDR